MRFALLEAKIALIELLKRFIFLRAPDTQVRCVWFISKERAYQFHLGAIAYTKARQTKFTVYCHRPHQNSAG